MPYKFPKSGYFKKKTNLLKDKIKERDKQYYENKLKNQNFICDVCKCEGHITNKSRHLKTKKHIKLYEKNKEVAPHCVKEKLE